MALGSKLDFIHRNLNPSCDKFRKTLFRSLTITGLALYILSIFLSNHPCSQSWELLWDDRDPNITSSTASLTTDISHIVFGIAGSTKTWKYRKPYVEGWWRPNITRGYVWLDTTPTQYLPWPPSSPPFRVSEDTSSKFKSYNKHGMPHAIRMIRIISDTFKAVDNNGVKWYVMADDDTVLFVDNLVEVLARYDHNKYFYIGHNSECISSNLAHSFEMAFRGAGYALSYPMAEMLSRHLDDCIKRYPTLYGSDHMLQSCLADLGVSLTHESGFHQIDLLRDISGLLSAHPQAPLLSLHHLDTVDPIFPFMNRYESLNLLMEAAKADSGRLLQQSICYDMQTNWTFSISWGYSVHIYEKIHPASVLRIPLETFMPWTKSPGPRSRYMFNTRGLSNDPCEAPHVFFFESVERTAGNQVLTKYGRRSPRKQPACSLNSNHSGDQMSEIRVFSPAKRLTGVSEFK